MCGIRVRMIRAPVIRAIGAGLSNEEHGHIKSWPWTDRCAHRPNVCSWCLLNMAMMSVIVHLILAISCVEVASQHLVDLADPVWTIGNGVNVSGIPGHLPSQAHLDLRAAKVIGDPLYGDNDYNQLWVQRSNWTWVSRPIHELYARHDPLQITTH